METECICFLCLFHVFTCKNETKTTSCCHLQFSLVKNETKIKFHFASCIPAQLQAPRYMPCLNPKRLNRHVYQAPMGPLASQMTSTHTQEWRVLFSFLCIKICILCIHIEVSFQIQCIQCLIANSTYLDTAMSSCHVSLY